MMLRNKPGAPVWDKHFGGTLDETFGRVHYEICRVFRRACWRIRPSAPPTSSYDYAVDAKEATLVVGDIRGAVDLGSGTPSVANGGNHPYVIGYAP